MSSSNPPEVTRPLDLIEALSVFSACYAVGGLVLVSMLLDLPLSWWSAATAFSITWFVYLLHRDRMARRQREAPSIRSRLLRRHARLVSILLGISGVLSLGTSVMTSVWLPLLLPASVLGMLLYGKGLDGRRPRDMLVIKNACVGMSMALFWIILAIAPVVGEFEVTPTFWSVVVAVTLLPSPAPSARFLPRNRAGSPARELLGHCQFLGVGGPEDLPTSHGEVPLQPGSKARPFS